MSEATAWDLKVGYSWKSRLDVNIAGPKCPLQYPVPSLCLLLEELCCQDELRLCTVGDSHIDSVQSNEAYLGSVRKVGETDRESRGGGDGPPTAEPPGRWRQLFHCELAV